MLYYKKNTPNLHILKTKYLIIANYLKDPVNYFLNVV